MTDDPQGVVVNPPVDEGCGHDSVGGEAPSFAAKLAGMASATMTTTSATSGAERKRGREDEGEVGVRPTSVARGLVGDPSSPQLWTEDVTGAQRPPADREGGGGNGPQFPSVPPATATADRPRPPQPLLRTKSGLILAGGVKSKQASPLTASSKTVPPPPAKQLAGKGPTRVGSLPMSKSPSTLSLGSIASPTTAVSTGTVGSTGGGSPKTPLSAAGNVSNSSVDGASTRTVVSSSGGGLADRMANAFGKILQVEDGNPVTDYTEEELRTVAKSIGAAIAQKGAMGPDIARGLLFHLKDPLNQNLREKVRGGFITADEFIAMPEYELQNPQEKERSAAATEERMRHRNWTELKKNVSNRTHLFRCPKCGKNDCSMIHKQTRSGDEPMTAFLTCLKCGTAFRRQA